MLRYLALAADYDGTLALDGALDGPTVAALRRLKASGRRLLMVTGRELDELLRVCPQVELFDLVVAENGALLYDPGHREEVLLADRPPDAFVARLREKGVAPLSVGRAIVATWVPHERAVLEAIRELGLELQVIFNKRAVMVLPGGVNKATGLREALRRLGLSPRNVVAVGDAENDHAMLADAECGVAVANAIPSLIEAADWTTSGARGAGVAELIDRLVRDDLAGLAPTLARRAIPLGSERDDEAREYLVPPFGVNVMVAGTSGSGKSTLVTGVLERLADRGYQACVVDPEGDYTNLPGAIVLGGPDAPPTVEEVLDVLAHPGQAAVASLIGLSMPHRPEFFDALMPRIQELRARTGRPHWLAIDEAHHLLPKARDPATLPRDLGGALFITVHPESVAPAVLASVGQAWAVGEEPGETLRAFAGAIGEAVPDPGPVALEPGECLAWPRRPEPGRPRVVRTLPPRTERLRHSRKYAEGELPPELSFTFTGPDGALRLRAQNLALFLQIGEGVDDRTWLHHLRAGDFARWFAESLNDRDLADEAREVARRLPDDPEAGRRALREAIARRYVLPG